MDSIEKTLLANFFTYQSAIPQFKEVSYLQRIVEKYAESGFPLGEADYSRFIAEAAAEEGIDPGQMKLDIREYLSACWKQGTYNQWAASNNWSRETPPNIDTAIKLICLSYGAFVRKSQSDRNTYLRIEIGHLGIPNELLEQGYSSMEILSSGRYMSFDDANEIYAYIWYLSFRVQHDIYELCMESGRLADNSWDDFVRGMRKIKSLRDMAKIVLQRTLNNFLFEPQYNFDVETVELMKEGSYSAMESDFMKCAELLSFEEGNCFIDAILFRAEVDQYRRQLRRKREYTWEQYLTELTQNKPLWDEVKKAFLDALSRLDFKPMWQSKELEEIATRGNAENKEESPDIGDSEQEI